MASFTDLPQVLLQLIFSYIPHHRSLCNLGVTCTEFQAISQQHRFWRALSHRRWKLPGPGDTREAYKQRHLQEVRVKGLIRTLSTVKDKSEQLQNGMVEIAEMVDDDIVKACWNVYQDVSESQQARKLARVLVRLLHCISVYKKSMQLHEQVVLSSDEDAEGTQVLLEEAVFEANRMFYEIQGPIDTITFASMQQQLDMIAETMRARLSEDSSPEQKLATLRQVLKEMPFTQLPLLYSAFGSNMTYPLNHLLLHKFLGRRIGLQVDIYSKPIPTQELYSGVVPAVRRQIRIGQWPYHPHASDPRMFEYLPPCEVVDHVSRLHRQFTRNHGTAGKVDKFTVMYEATARLSQIWRGGQANDEQWQTFCWCDPFVDAFLKLDNIDDCW